MAAPVRKATVHAPRIPRRVSGPVPVRKPISGATVEIPQTLRRVPDARLLDRLLRSRAWIWLIGIMLGGIVFMQVTMLKLDAGISRAVDKGAALERDNALLEEQVAELQGGDRIGGAASRLGLISPSPGSVDYLTARPGRDASLAARRIQPPTPEARELLSSGGRKPGTVAAVTPTGVTAAPATTTQTQPVATATATPAATPVATVAPAPTQAPPSTSSSGGVAAAP